MSILQRAHAKSLVNYFCPVENVDVIPNYHTIMRKRISVLK